MAEARQFPAVIQDLLANPQKFSFNQVVRLLLLWTKEKGIGKWRSLLYERVRFRPALSLGYAVSDVEDLELEPSSDPNDPCPFDTARITASFLGLYGVSSPLPTFYTERLLDEQAEDRSVTRDFIDIFNSVFYLCFLRLSSIVSPLRRGLMENDEIAGHMLMSLASFGDASLRARLPDDLAFLRYAGLFFQSVRSAAGLRLIMAGIAGCGKADIQCNVTRLAAVPDEQRLSLGRAACSLGEDAILGDGVPCHEGKIVVTFDQLDEEGLRGLLPGTRKAALLHDFVRAYCRDPLEYEVVLRLLPGEARPLCLGGDGAGCFATLGHDAWTGFGGEVARAPLPRASAFFPAGFADRQN
ncbi:MAG: type VI secretion system baseplate subunit TssG [Desulfovibrio sp.]|jgi:type VI secretion system protein ImpH|nr:type VI secretion system baseplate subunit TssG [Desulfovibrio sp.]